MVYNIPDLYNNKKNLQRDTEADTHEIPELYVIKTEIKERGSFY